MEPGCHLFYFGNTLRTIGGINWDKNKALMDRIINQVRNDSSLLKPNSVEFSQPYYSWEANLGEHGVKAPYEATQTYIANGFRGLVTFSQMFTDDHYAHVRVKK